MNRALLAFALVMAACAKKQPPPPATDHAPPMPAAEVQRSRDACQAYVDKVCACASQHADSSELKRQCELARAEPDAIRLALEVAASPDSNKDDVLQAQTSVRKTVKVCIEETAKLPSLGCQ